MCSIIQNKAKEKDFNTTTYRYYKPGGQVWNTKKYGTFYFLLPHVSIFNAVHSGYGLFYAVCSLRDDLKVSFSYLFLSIMRGVLEYNFGFHRKIAFNARIGINNLELSDIQYFSIDLGFNFLYGKKKNHIFSGAFYPIGWCSWLSKSCLDNFLYCFTFSFILFKYEYNRCFYLNFGKIKQPWVLIVGLLNGIREEKDIGNNLNFMKTFLLGSLVSVEIGLNILGVHEWRKNKKTEQKMK